MFLFFILEILPFPTVAENMIVHSTIITKIVTSCSSPRLKVAEAGGTPRGILREIGKSRLYIMELRGWVRSSRMVNRRIRKDVKVTGGRGGDCRSEEWGAPDIH